MCSPSIITTILDPIGAISKKIGGIGGALFDPVGTIHRKVGGALGDLGPIGNVVSGFVDPGRFVSGKAFMPETKTNGDTVSLVGQGGVARDVSTPIPTYTPPSPTAFNPPGAQLPTANTYAEGMNKFGQGTGQFSTAIDEKVIGPFNQGGQKAVKKVSM